MVGVFMFIGSTDKERLDNFLIIEENDSASEVFKFMEEKNVNNLIVDANLCNISILDNVDFYQIFEKAKIVHLANIDLKKSSYLYQFKNANRFEIKNCKFSGKEPINFHEFSNLEEIFTIYSKRFENLFNHPKLKTLFIEGFNILDFNFPLNNVLESLSLEKSAECKWSTLSNFKKLKALYLVSISSITDISRLSNLSYLEDIELTYCKKIENCIEGISNVSSLKSVWLAYMGNFDSLKPLSKLTKLKELTIESGGKLVDKDISFLKNIQGLEYSIEMSNCVTSNE